MQGTMLEIAKSDLLAAERLLSDTDDLTLQQAAYYVQQSVEKALKHIFMQRGTKPPKTHNIGALLDLLSPSWDLPRHILDGLTARADSLTMWEEKTRYPNDYMATRNAVLSVIPPAKALLLEVDKHYKPQSTRNPGSIRKMNLFGDK